MNDRCIRITRDMDATRAMLEAVEFARRAGFDDTPGRMIGTAVSELARNILKYAVRGEIHLRRIQGMKRGVEIEAVDRGPGIPDTQRALEDHFSSSGTLGLGLPGVKRLMDEFELDSAPGEGTRVKARKWL